MRGHRRAATRERVHMTGIGELIVHIDRGGVLKKFPEARTRIGEAPRGRLNLECGKRLDGAAKKLGRHRGKSQSLPRGCQAKSR